MTKPKKDSAKKTPVPKKSVTKKAPTKIKKLVGAPTLFHTCRICGTQTDRVKAPCTASQHVTYSDHLITLVANGASLNRAVAETGITYQGMLNWRHKGEDALTLKTEGYAVPKELEPFILFVEKLTRACGRVALNTELYLGKLVQAATTGSGDLDPRDAIAILERLDRTRWGKALTLHHEGEMQVSIVDRYAEAIAALIEGILTDLLLSDEQQERAPEIVEKHMNALTAKGGGVGSQA